MLNESMYLYHQCEKVGATLASKRRKKHTKNSRVGKGDKKSFSSAGESQFQTFDPSSCPKGLLLLSLSWRLCPRVWKSQKKRKETFFLYSTTPRTSFRKKEVYAWWKVTKICIIQFWMHNLSQTLPNNKKKWREMTNANEIVKPSIHPYSRL